jgi:hypothetical protein
MARQKDDRRTFSAISSFSEGKVKLLNTLRVTLMVLGVVLLLLTLDASLTTSHSGPQWAWGDSVTCILAAIVIAWVCYFGFGKVFVSGSSVKSQNLWRRSAKKDDIERIDIITTYFGRRLNYVPIVVLKTGKSFQLRPLTWRTPVLANNPGWTVDRQREIVHELRTLLSTDGKDGVPPA